MIVGIIPARFASTRLMGKPLADIGGKPLLQHTYESSLKSNLLGKVVIAVDDEKVETVAKSFGAEVIMTPKNILTGSDRIAFVAHKLPEAEIIVNIQGDEPFIPGKMIDQAIEPLLFDKSVQVSSLARRIKSVDELKSDSIPKVVIDYSNYALYFSRAEIPFIRDLISEKEKLKKYSFYKHIGLYVYRRNALFQFTSLEQTDLEKAEKLEQLRMLENGIKIKMVITEFDSLSVDTPEDLAKARAYFNSIKKK